jgi:hypothetical protein
MLLLLLFIIWHATQLPQLLCLRLLDSAHSNLVAAARIPSATHLAAIPLVNYGAVLLLLVLLLLPRCRADPHTIYQPHRIVHHPSYIHHARRTKRQCHRPRYQLVSDNYKPPG